jgi:hypothetical protein
MVIKGQFGAPQFCEKNERCVVVATADLLLATVARRSKLARVHDQPSTYYATPVHLLIYVT